MHQEISQRDWDVRMKSERRKNKKSMPEVKIPAKLG